MGSLFQSDTMKTAEQNQSGRVLDRLHKDAKKDDLRMAKAMLKSAFGPMSPERFEHAYLPISRKQGLTLQKIISENKCQRIVEFGTSFGVSTIYLAEAARLIDGQVITTELLDSKARKAEANIAEAGLTEQVEIRIGDAMKTLVGHSEPIDLLVLDGWKDLYLPLFEMLEHCFHSGTLIYADNMDMDGTKPYAEFLKTNEAIYRTQRMDEGKAFLTQISWIQ